MKNTLTAMAVLLLTAGVAQADMFDGSSVSVLGGWTSHPNLTVGAGNVPTGDSYNAGVRFGRNLFDVPNVTWDADYFYNRARLPASARLDSNSIMGDLIYHLPMDFPLHLYGGGGVGVVSSSLGGSLHGSSEVLGWQAIGGAEFPLSERTALFAEYRYQNAHDANFSGGRVGNTSNNVSLGFKFTL